MKFSYIAGYTTCGFPYGITHEELGEVDEVKPLRDAVWEKMIGSVIASTGDYLESATRNGP